MTGGIMPKLAAARWPIGIFVVLLFFTWGATHALREKSVAGAAWSLLDGGDFDGERRELQFWLAALGRIETEMRHSLNGSASVSLRTEQSAVLARLREVASRVPPASLPADIRSVIEPEPAAASAAAIVALAVEQPAPTLPAGELRAGLGRPAAMADLNSLVFVAPPAPPVFIEKRHAPRAAADKDEKRPTSPAADREEKRPTSPAAADREEKRPRPAAARS